MHLVAVVETEIAIKDRQNHTIGGTENPGVKPKILIVDDQKEVCVAMKRYFTVCGFDVECASELEEAEAMITCNSYAVLISDLHLTPIRGNEGLELIRVLRHRSPQTRTVMLTAYSTPDVEKEAYACGVAKVLNKPVALSELRRILQEFLER